MNSNRLSYLLIKLTVFSMPFVLLTLSTFICDPYKALYEHSDYDNNFTDINMGNMSYRLYRKKSDNMHYDSFIFGNSRSLAYRIDKYLKYLPPDSAGFHFIASGGGIYDIYHQIKFIDDTGGIIKNALLVLDGYSLSKTTNNYTPTNVLPYQLSNESRIKYYLTIIRPNLSFLFNISYLDYRITGKYKQYMLPFISPQKGELSHLRTIFFDRNLVKKYLEGSIQRPTFISLKKRPITKEEIYYLSKISSYLKKHKTHYKVVISPLYDQVPLDNGQLALLSLMFNSSNIYNFSGINKFTESTSNYLDSSHYKSSVGDEILDMIHN